MSVETQPNPPFTRENDSVRTQVEDMTSEEVQKCLNGIMNTADDASAKQERLAFARIAKIFQEAYEEHRETKQQQIERILDTFLENPAQSVPAEFRQLKLIYSERIDKKEATSSTMRTEEFCLQDHDKHSIDYLMQEISTDDGDSFIRVSSHFDLGEQTETPVEIVCHDGELVAYAKIYQGREATTRDVELDEQKTRMCLMQLFRDTINASAFQIERSDELRKQYDNEATTLLARLAL